MDEIETEELAADLPMFDGTVIASDHPAILDLWKDIKGPSSDEAARYIRVGEVLEKWVEGDQQEIKAGIPGTDAVAYRYAIPQVTVNYLRGVVDIYKATVTADRPSVTAYATYPTPQAKAAAAIARDLIDFYEKEWQIDPLIDEVVRLGIVHGTAGVKTIYNPASDSVEWAAVSIFDMLIDCDAPSFEDAQWCAFKSYISKFEAKRIAKTLGSNEVFNTTTYKVNGSAEKEGVEVWEIWYKPDARVPRGLYCKMIGQTVYDATDYPYMMMNLDTNKPEAMLPLSMFKIYPKRGTPYADTWLSDVLGSQQVINEIETSLTQIRRATSNIKLQVSNDALAQQLTPENQFVVGDGEMKWLGPPPINQLLFADRQQHQERIYDLAGIKQDLYGASQIKSGTSAKQIAYLKELDAMKRKSVSQSLQKMLIFAWRNTLQLIQKYYLGSRIIRIGHGDDVRELAFKAADIMGITVDLAPREGLDRLPQAKEAQVEADVQTGIVPAEQLQESRLTASAEPTINDFQVQKIHDLVRKALQADTEMSIDTGIDPAVALSELAEISQLLSEGWQRQIVDQLIAKYADLQAQQQPQAPASPEQIPPQT